MCSPLRDVTRGERREGAAGGDGPATSLQGSTDPGGTRTGGGGYGCGCTYLTLPSLCRHRLIYSHGDISWNYLSFFKKSLPIRAGWA